MLSNLINSFIPCLGFIAVAAVLTIVHLVRSRRFVETVAKITKSEVVDMTNAETAAKRDWNYVVEIEFSYLANGQEHSQGKYSSFPTRCAELSAAQYIANLYPVGSTHPAWYDSKKPQIALLKPGAVLSYLVMFCFIVALVCWVVAYAKSVPLPEGQKLVWHALSFIAVGATVIAGWMTWREIKVALSRFIPVSGRVRVSDVEEFSKTQYRSNIIFDYEVEGRQYNSGVYRINGAPVFSQRSKAEALCSRYSPGSECGAWYMESSPGRAVIDKNINKNPLYALVVAVGLLVYLLAVVPSLGGWLGG